MGPIERNQILWDFSDGRIGILCAVDVLNEGVDVPDVNLVVFQRVTHSRRIFVQQLGRGLRLVRGEDKGNCAGFRIRRPSVRSRP